jgi:hypothetical protein
LNGALRKRIAEPTDLLVRIVAECARIFRVGFYGARHMSKVCATNTLLDALFERRDMARKHEEVGGLFAVPESMKF